MVHDIRIGHQQTSNQVVRASRICLLFTVFSTLLKLPTDRSTFSARCENREFCLKSSHNSGVHNNETLSKLTDYKPACRNAKLIGHAFSTVKANSLSLLFLFCMGLNPFCDSGSKEEENPEERRLAIREASLRKDFSMCRVILPIVFSHNVYPGAVGGDRRSPGPKDEKSRSCLFFASTVLLNWRCSAGGKMQLESSRDERNGSISDSCSAAPSSSISRQKSF